VQINLFVLHDVKNNLQEKNDPCFILIQKGKKSTENRTKKTRFKYLSTHIFIIGAGEGEHIYNISNTQFYLRCAGHILTHGMCYYKQHYFNGL
jgi:hypothetical protein